MSRNSNDNRPQIWSEGRQHLPLNPRTFALASVGFARDGLAGLLGRCAGSARDFGGAVFGGLWRIPEDRLGRTGRYLPSHRRVGQAVTEGAALLERTARVVRPNPEAVAPSIFHAAPLAPRPVRRLPPAAEAALRSEDPADAELVAIRALMDPAPALSLPEVPCVADTSTEPAVASPPAGAGRLALVRDAFASALGYGLLVVAVPYGAIKAGIAHLNGEDLRRLVD
ncbi:hypothetical protein LHP98_04705 [Rhodobacter sp. Har01]|uniref:hypothetical protein n=1 Tax=Rhodobacter sp. Har01 TaxID=2883999 RepID=UPI001D05F9BC|nr:hypothetical protein [Rhodobacter sp. Har01]MCB6177429.1 hypothetical protein [Rhodobacter sp. Har01]